MTLFDISERQSEAVADIVCVVLRHPGWQGFIFFVADKESDGANFQRLAMLIYLLHDCAWPCG